MKVVKMGYSKLTFMVDNKGTVDEQNPSIPYLSIIIPVYNAQKTLKKCLRAIFSSDYQDFEVIVIDDGSRDNSLEIASLFNCQIIKSEHNQGASATRNKGTKMAKGEVLLFIDADIVIKRDTLNLFVESLKDYAAVFGIYSQKPGINNLLSLYQNFYAHKSMMATKEITSMFYSYCAAIKKGLFEQVGGFNETWKRATFEDVEFGLRVAEKGHQIYLHKRIEVVHHVSYNLKRFFKNYYYKSLDLSKFMFSKKRLSLSNEGWTNYKNQLSLLAGLSIIPLLILTFMHPWFILPLLAPVGVFMFLNADFYKFILGEKPIFIPAAIFLNLMVHLVAAAGITVGLISYLKEKGVK